jgi:hypothetical protein
MNQNTITVAAIYAPGRAIFGTCLLDLTEKAWDLGINLSGADIRAARPADGGGYWLEGACEDKHYGADGKIDN